MNETKERTCLWFDGNGEEAAEFYVSLLPDSKIITQSHSNPDTPPLVIELSLAGAPYMFLNGGSQYQLSPAASIVIRTIDQAETDRLWKALLIKQLFFQNQRFSLFTRSLEGYFVRPIQHHRLSKMVWL